MPPADSPRNGQLPQAALGHMDDAASVNLPPTVQPEPDYTVVFEDADGVLEGRDPYLRPWHYPIRRHAASGE